MVIIGGTGSIMGTLMGTAFVVMLPESMEWISAGLKGSAIDRALSLNNNITFLREISIGVIIIAFLMFEPDGLAHRWRQIKTYWKLYPFHIEVATGPATIDINRPNGGDAMMMKSLLSSVSLALLLSGAAVTAQAQIAIGQLADYSGGTSDVERPMGKASRMHLRGSTRTAGSATNRLTSTPSTMATRCPRQSRCTRSVKSRQQGGRHHGLGHGRHRGAHGFRDPGHDTGHFRLLCRRTLGPTGASGKAKAAPYNFFYGPTYSDALRAELTWAAEDWKAKGKPGKPKFVHMGANHPFPNAPKAAGEALANELGLKCCHRWCSLSRPAITARNA